jgi:hypothetical protein
MQLAPKLILQYQNVAGVIMTKIFRILPALLAGYVCLGGMGEAKAQLSNPWATYSSDRFVNSNMQLFFEKRWQISRMRAQGKHQLADAMEGRSSSNGTSGNRQTTGTPLTGTTGAALLNAPLSMTSFNKAAPPSMHKRMVANIQGISAENRQQLEEVFLQLLKEYDRLLDQNGEQRLRNNLAGAFNFLFTVSYYSLKNGRELTDAQQNNMLEQINVAVAMGLKEQPISDREKQDMYEATVISGMLILSLYNEGQQGQPESLKISQSLARDLLSESMGISIDRVHVSGKTVQIN